MGQTLLIYNERSGSCDPAVLVEIEQMFMQAGKPIHRKLDISDGSLPGPADAAAFDLIVILSGDGSMAAVADALGDWEGTLLVLPGGTMNLLSRALHGERTPTDIVEAYLKGEGSSLHVPVLRSGKLAAYTGIIIGPSAAWGDVREDLRNLDVAALATNVPKAISATLNEPGVTIEGREGDYPAIFIEPSLTGVRAYGILASGAGDLFRHGWAWLQGDFRDGPSESLGIAPSMRFRAQGDRLDLLIDGEKADGDNPFDVHIGPSAVRFYAAQGEFAWR